MPVNVKLVVVGGDVKTTEISLTLPATIGRGRAASVVLPHPLVSRQHCELYEAAGQLMVRDLGSLNGTFINNERVTESPLAAGQLLTVGTVTFRAVYDDLPRDESEQRSLGAQPGDKTVHISKTRTFPAANPPPPGDAQPPTERLGKTLTQRNESQDTAGPAAQSGGPPLAGQRAPSKSAADVTVDFERTAPDDADEEQPASASDGDLGDFLKGLDK